ncbi:hypothetical protein [Moraxella marmotae]|uniref:hypothetical protein n=1 Tax=Moraxella marmotae TaxID=3344520 RepID=UPI0035F490D7
MSEKTTLREQIEKFENLSDTMHHAEKKRTLEEQVAYLKSQGIDPTKSYAKWDDEPEDD